MSIRRFIQVMRTPKGWMLRFRGSAGDITWHILATACPVEETPSAAFRGTISA